MDRKEMKKYLFIGTVAVGVMLIIKNLSYIGGFISLLCTAVYPLVLGCAIAFVFNILLSFCERYYFPKHNGKFVATHCRRRSDEKLADSKTGIPQTARIDPQHRLQPTPRSHKQRMGSGRGLRT